MDGSEIVNITCNVNVFQWTSITGRCQVSHVSLYFFLTKGAEFKCSYPFQVKQLSVFVLKMFKMWKSNALCLKFSDKPLRLHWYGKPFAQVFRKPMFSMRNLVSARRNTPKPGFVVSKPGFVEYLCKNLPYRPPETKFREMSPQNLFLWPIT